MSGLFSSLYTTTNAMRTQTAALDIVGRNMANVNNPAYARQRVVLGDKGSVNTPLGAQSLGTEPVGIQQMRDTLLDRQVTEETANTRLIESQIKYLQQAQTALGQGLFSDSGAVDTITNNPDLPAGIAASIDAFFNAWQAFATEPSSIVTKQQLIAKTDDLIDKIHLADTRLADIALPPAATGNTLTREMDADVGQVNALLTTLADLNRQIGQVEIINPGAAVDLRDARQSKLEELAKYVDFTTVQQSAGQLGIQISDGLGGTIDIVNLATVTGSLARNGDDYEWTPTAGVAQAASFAGGSLAGYQTVGATVQGYRDSLDTFVATLVSEVNTAYNSGTNGQFFLSTGTDAASLARVATATTVVAGDVGGPSGANNRALAVAGLANDATFLNGTPSTAYSRLVTSVAQDLTTTNTRAEDQQSLQGLLSAQRNSYGGVSLDEETADMMRYQRAYQASAKLMSIINEMLSDAMNTLAG
ncbi:MAG TPA: flagellar hook-associated protein FlgK [Opitutaceae bacterium]|nr:flagellar hook-associated protein FlgK [Opitutaceae bacterium]